MIPQYSDRLLTFSSTFQLDQFFSTGSIPTKLGIKHLLAKGIHVLMKETSSSKGRWYRNSKKTLPKLKNLLLQNQSKINAVLENPYQHIRVSSEVTINFSEHLIFKRDIIYDFKILLNTVSSLTKKLFNTFKDLKNLLTTYDIFFCKYREGYWIWSSDVKYSALKINIFLNIFCQHKYSTNLKEGDGMAMPLNVHTIGSQT